MLQTMAGDDLSIFLFFISLAVTFVVAAMSQAGWKHKALIALQLLLGGFSFLVGIFWPWIKAISPTLESQVRQLTQSPIAWFVVILFGVSTTLWTRKTDKGPRLLTQNSAPAEGQKSLMADGRPGKRFIPADWNAPLIRVFGERYQHETVELDGKQFMNCTFEDVNLRYQGERPFLIINCTFASKNSEATVTIRSDNPIIGQIVQLLYVAGVIKHPNSFKIGQTDDPR